MLSAEKAAAFGMLADHLLARGAVDAVDLVVGHIAVDPLNLRAEVAQHRTGGLGRGP
jgi:hypothetical protein